MNIKKISREFCDRGTHRFATMFFSWQCLKCRVKCSENESNVLCVGRCDTHVMSPQQSAFHAYSSLCDTRKSVEKPLEICYFRKSFPERCARSVFLFLRTCSITFFESIPAVHLKINRAKHKQNNLQHLFYVRLATVVAVCSVVDAERKWKCCPKLLLFMKIKYAMEKWINSHDQKP